MQKVNVSQAKYLRALLIVPAAQAIQVYALAQTVGDVSQESTHECEIVSIYRNECGHIVLVRIVKVGLILLVDQSSKLFLYSIVDDPCQLFSPNLFSLNVEEVLNVLNRSLEASKFLTKHLEFRF